MLNIKELWRKCDGTKTALKHCSVSLDGEILTNERVPVSSMDNPEGCDNIGKNIENNSEHEKSLPSNFAVGSEPLPLSSTKSMKHNSSEESRVPVATRFQRVFVQLLYNAQFEELSAADLMLTSALNTDYLLTLPIYVDWKKSFESKAIMFRYSQQMCQCAFWDEESSSILPATFSLSDRPPSTPISTTRC